MLAIIIPAFNRSECLGRALRSLENQTTHKFFTVVVDDGSTEDLRAVCDQSSLNLKYIRHTENKGPGMARQTGINWCIANNIEYIMFLDSDDLYVPHAVETLLYEINHSLSDMVVAGCTVIQPHKPKYHVEAIKNRTWSGSRIIRTSTLINHDISFNPKIKTNEDLEFMLRIYASDAKITGLIDDYLYVVQINDSSLCHTEQKGTLDLSYIEAIYYSTLWMLEHNGSLKTNFQNIINCYQYYQNCLIYDYPIPQYIDDMLIELFKIKTYQIYFSKLATFQGLTVPCSLEVNKEIKFYKETFGQWLNNHKFERIKIC